MGGLALHSTDGITDVAMGYKALYLNTSGSWNTATGAEALRDNGAANTAGYQALLFNTTGNFNTATGIQALYQNTSGGKYRAGNKSLSQNTNGISNT
jgi:hypothetical protein